MKRKAFGVAALAAATSLAWTIPSEARVTQHHHRPHPGCSRRSNVRNDHRPRVRRARSARRHNALITDIDARSGTARQGEYVASFHIVKPKDMAQGERADVARRAQPRRAHHHRTDLRAQSDIGLSSGWQGDNAGATRGPGQCVRRPGAGHAQHQRMGKDAGAAGVTGHDLRPHHQPQRSQRSPERDGQSDSVFPGERRRQQPAP